MNQISIRFSSYLEYKKNILDIQLSYVYPLCFMGGYVQASYYIGKKNIGIVCVYLKKIIKTM